MNHESIPENPVPPINAWRLLFIALGVSAAAVFFWLRGGWNLGLTLAITVAQAGLWLYSGALGQKGGTNGLKRFSPGRRLLLVSLAVASLYLGSTYYFYANEMLHALNFLVLLVLFVVQSILLTQSSTHDWDTPLFWVEAGLAPIVRPFVSLSRLGVIIKEATGSHSDLVPGTKSEGSVTRPGRIFGQILLGILLAIPVLLIAGSLLASADKVFGQVVSNILDYWKNVEIQEELASLALMLVLFPFIFSYLESSRIRWHLVTARSRPAGQDHDPSHQQQSMRLNPITLNAFLASINALYILFAVIQVAYLTGAFRFVLPDGLSYAEYARNGFFELAGITPINVLLILLAVKGAGRTGTAGHVLRIQSLLLILGSFIQWLSAMFRMQMYIQVYDLTLLRFFVSAFMILMAIIFVFLVVKEFKPSFAFFKTAAITALLSLVLLNAVDADTRIARFNVERATTDSSRVLDLAYFRQLSPDVLLVLQEAAPRFDIKKQDDIRVLIEGSHADYQQASEVQPWQDLNWRESRFLSQVNRSGPLD